MTTSSKQRKIAVSQCRSVEKLAEAVERINGQDAELSTHLNGIKCQMRAARRSICDEDEITEEFPLPLVRAEDLGQLEDQEEQD